MYNMKSLLENDIIHILCGLHNLQKLDISCDVSAQIFNESMSVFDVNSLLDAFTKSELNNLSFLDLSGKIGIQEKILIKFLQSYPKLRFLGLALTRASQFVGNHNDAIITGESSVSQLIISLKKYKHRHLYVQKLLIQLYKGICNNQIGNASIKLIDLMELLIEIMNIHRQVQCVQLSATSCIYYILSTKLKLPVLIANELLEATLKTMQYFTHQVAMIVPKNCLLILEEDLTILKNCVSYNINIFLL